MTPVAIGDIQRTQGTLKTVYNAKNRYRHLLLCLPCLHKHALRGILFRFYGVALPESDLQETFYERTFPGYSRFVRPDVPALRPGHHYDNNIHNSTIYS